MEKDFDGWNDRKKAINSRTTNVFYKEREVWWCFIGLNVGSEEDGKGGSFRRPVVIIRVFNKNMFFGVALTTRNKTDRYHFYLGEIGLKESSAILSQVRLTDSKRLGNKICTLNPDIFDQLKNALQRTLFS